MPGFAEPAAAPSFAPHAVPGGPAVPGVAGYTASTNTDAAALAVMGEPLTMSLMVVNSQAGAVIGRNGVNIRQIRADTGAHIQMEEIGSTRDRKVRAGPAKAHRSPLPLTLAAQLTLSGTFEQVQTAMFHVMHYLRAAALAAASGQPPAQETLKLLVPHAQAGSIIGRSGQYIDYIRAVRAAAQPRLCARHWVLMPSARRAAIRVDRQSQLVNPGHGGAGVRACARTSTREQAALSARCTALGQSGYCERHA